MLTNIRHASLSLPASVRALVTASVLFLWSQRAVAVEYMLPMAAPDNIAIEVISDPKELDRIRRLAANEDVESLFRLFSHCWATSKEKSGTEKIEGHDLALRYAYKAALKGHAKAQFVIASCYSESNCKVDYEKALMWFQRSAEGGFVPAMAELSRIYGRGSVVKGVAESEVVKQDPAKWLSWKQRAAEAGDVPSQNLLAFNHYVGEAVTGKDIDKAFYYSNKAAQQDSAVATYILGRIYFSGYAGQRVDYVEAVRRIAAAAEKGHRRAMFDMGTFHRTGEAGVPKDLKLSHQWYRRTAEMPEDLSDGEIFRGTLYDTGTRAFAALLTSLDFVLGSIVDKNCDEAVRWAQVAEATTSAEVVRELPVLQGYLKLSECAGSPDPEAAKALFAQAKALGATLRGPSDSQK